MKIDKRTLSALAAFIAGATFATQACADIIIPGTVLRERPRTGRSKVFIPSAASTDASFDLAKTSGDVASGDVASKDVASEPAR